MSPLDLGLFKLESAVIEARYSEAFLLWDNAGHLWKALLRQYPKATVKRGEPGTTVFHLDKAVEMTVELGRARVLHYRPDADMTRLAEVSTHVFEAVVKQLEVSDFTRIGLRLAYWREYPSLEEAARVMIGEQFTRLYAVQSPVKDGAVTQTEIVTRWESKTVGIYAAIRSQSRQLTLDVPLNAAHLVEVRGQDETHGILQDVDYYTRGIVSAEQLRPRLWIEQAAKAAKRALQQCRYARG